MFTHQYLLTSVPSLQRSVGGGCSDTSCVFLAFVCRPACGQNKTFKVSCDRFWRFTTRLILCCGEYGDTSWSTFGFDLVLNCLHRGATWIINSWFPQRQHPSPHTHTHTHTLALSLFWCFPIQTIVAHDYYNYSWLWRQFTFWSTSLFHRHFGAWILVETACL